MARTGPDGVLRARVSGAAQRLAAAAVSELRDMAGERADLLGHAAGLLLGYYGDSERRIAAELLIAAGADLDEVKRAAKLGRERA